MVRVLGWAWKGGHAACRACVDAGRVPEFFEGSGFRVTVYDAGPPNFAAPCSWCGTEVRGENCSTTNLVEEDMSDNQAIVLAKDTVAQLPAVTDEWLAELRAYVISTDEEEQMIAAVLRGVKDKHDFADEKRKTITKPLNDAMKATNALFKPSLEAYKEVEKLLKDKIADYIARKQQANTAALHAAAAAATPEQAVRAIESTSPVAPPGGVSIRYQWKFEVVDPNAVPRELCSPDDKKIQAALAAGMQVPGVRVFQEPIVSSRR